MANVNCCPTCGRRLPRPKATPIAEVDTAQLTDAELHAHYKRIAPVKDCQFWAEHCGQPKIRMAFIGLLAKLEAQGGQHTPATRAEYLRLQADWRRSRREYGPPPATPGEKWQVYFITPHGQYLRHKAGKVYEKIWGVSQPCIIKPAPAPERMQVING